MRIRFGNDHVVVELKNILMEHLRERGYEYIDLGPSDPAGKVNYPEPDRLVTEALMRSGIHKDVLICGTGVGISPAANEVPGIRAAACSEPYSAKLIIEHNNANIIVTSTRVVDTELAKMIVDEFFTARFEGGRHAMCVDMISETKTKYGAKWHE